jgi:hypothetical protein
MFGLILATLNGSNRHWNKNHDSALHGIWTYAHQVYKGEDIEDVETILVRSRYVIFNSLSPSRPMFKEIRLKEIKSLDQTDFFNLYAHVSQMFFAIDFYNGNLEARVQYETVFNRRCDEEYFVEDEVNDISNYLGIKLYHLFSHFDYINDNPFLKSQLTILGLAAMNQSR